MGRHSDTRFKDHFSTGAGGYARYRPGYPPALFDYLGSLAPATGTAWDCATGSGQAACRLAETFQQVIATDASQAQIEAAKPCAGVVYRASPAEQSGIASHSVDLVTVAQALHWFEIERFYEEVQRVLKPGGIIAVWSYNLFRVDPGFDSIIDRLYHTTLRGFWPAERKLVEHGYRDIPFPFQSPPTLPNFSMEARWDLDRLEGYLTTWSAVKRYIDANGVDPIAALSAELEQGWGERARLRNVMWPLSLRVGINH